MTDKFMTYTPVTDESDSDAHVFENRVMAVFDNHFAKSFCRFVIYLIFTFVTSSPRTLDNFEHTGADWR
jgi:hypothetical protein